MPERCRPAQRTPTWTLRDLTLTGTDGQPAEQAYSAMAALLAGPFLDATPAERARQVHGGHPCRPVCELCRSMALKYAQWATRKLHGHRRSGPPTTNGDVVRDWVTLLEWVERPGRADQSIAEVRAALARRLDTADPLLPLVYALRTQLLVSAHQGKGPRKARDAVMDMRRAVVAQQQGWSVKPDRDSRTGKRFATVRTAHPRGFELLQQLLRLLDYGEPEPYERLWAWPGRQPGDPDALRALLVDMLDDPWLHDWYLREVDRRQSYNQERARERVALAGGPGWS